MIRLSVILLGILLSTGRYAHAHGGILDKIGCHTDHKLGGYHCHRGHLAGQKYFSKGEALSASKAKSSSLNRPTNLPYDRNFYRHWIDADRDCQDARQEVLITESLVPVKLDGRGCRVVSGRWYDSYTGRTITNPRQLDIDHMVPLAEAHRSGASKWNASKKEKFANDLSHPDSLIAVSAGENRSKGDKDPADWMPSNKAFHCQYVAAWVTVKTNWGLKMDKREFSAVQRIQKSCP
jgi:hypothetical protein